MTDLPPLPYGRQWLDDDDIEAVQRILRGDWLTTGPTVASFEEALMRRVGAQHAIVVNSGTAALHTTYAAAGLTRGDRIVTSPLTFIATASAALHLGAEVDFVDVTPDTGNIDPAAADAAVTDRTRLVVAIDFAGHPADYDALNTLLAPRGLKLVADAAHSLGAAYHGRPVGSLCDATTTSFHPVKPITTGEGGAIFTNDANWARRAAEFRNHGIVRDAQHWETPEEGPWYHEVQSLGLNYRLPDILCALGLSQLAKLDRFIDRRRRIAARYLDLLKDLDTLELPHVDPHTEPGWHLFILRVRDADRRLAFFNALREENILPQLHYIPAHLHPLMRRLGHRPGSCPVAEDFAARSLSLPIYPKMTDDDVERVAESVRVAAARVL